MRARRGVAGGGHEQLAEDQCDDHHGHVDQEDRAPPEVLEQPAAGHRADGDSHAGHGGPDGDGLPPLPAVGEHVGDDRQRGGHDQRAADAHQGPGADELVGAVGQRRQDRPDAHDRQADGEGAAAAEAVAERAHRQQQAGEHQDVGVHDPLELAGRRPELALEAGDGHVDDRVVHHDQQQAEAHDGQHDPAAGILQGCLGARHGGGRCRCGHAFHTATPNYGTQ